MPPRRPSQGRKATTPKEEEDGTPTASAAAAPGKSSARKEPEDDVERKEQPRPEEEEEEDVVMVDAHPTATTTPVPPSPAAAASAAASSGRTLTSIVGADADALVDGDGVHSRESKYSRLHHLLDQTSLFSQFLSERMPERFNAINNAAAEKEATATTTKGKQHLADRAAELAALLPPGRGLALRPFQVAGVDWLISLYENGLNGILADEMGLGKTLQLILFLGHLRRHRVYGPFLIVAPLSTLASWQAESRRWQPDTPVLVYHGTKEQRAGMRAEVLQRALGATSSAVDATFPVVVTSYEIALADASFLRRIHWKQLVVDEGQRLKNHQSLLMTTLRGFPSENRLLLTGTPLQNSLVELWSLLHFLLPDIFASLAQFATWFDFGAGAGTEGASGVGGVVGGGGGGGGEGTSKSLSSVAGQQYVIGAERDHLLVTKLHSILRPFVLRRVKSDVLAGLLREKVEYTLYCPMTALQRWYYRAILDGTMTKENILLKAGGRNANASSSSSSSASSSASSLTLHVRNVLMQLRKVCNHPYLVVSDADEARLGIDMERRAEDDAAAADAADADGADGADAAQDQDEQEQEEEDDDQSRVGSTAVGRATKRRRRCGESPCASSSSISSSSGRHSIGAGTFARRDAAAEKDRGATTTTTAAAAEEEKEEEDAALAKLKQMLTKGGGGGSERRDEPSPSSPSTSEEEEEEEEESESEQEDDPEDGEYTSLTSGSRRPTRRAAAISTAAATSASASAVDDDGAAAASSPPVDFETIAQRNQRRNSHQRQDEVKRNQKRKRQEQEENLQQAKKDATALVPGVASSSSSAAPSASSFDAFDAHRLSRVCGKLRVLDALLPELRRRGHRVLIFSQMTRMLDVLEDYLVALSAEFEAAASASSAASSSSSSSSTKAKPFKFCRIDGTTSSQERASQLQAFNNDESSSGGGGDEYFVFLLSTRAGGLGLNLASADTVILYDSDWNPHADTQAADRVHRLTQTRAVLVFRLVTPGSVEVGMVARALGKKRLEQVVLTKGRFHQQPRMHHNNNATDGGDGDGGGGGGAGAGSASAVGPTVTHWRQQKGIVGELMELFQMNTTATATSTGASGGGAGGGGATARRDATIRMELDDDHDHDHDDAARALEKEERAAASGDDDDVEMQAAEASSKKEANTSTSTTATSKRTPSSSSSRRGGRKARPSSNGPEEGEGEMASIQTPKNAAAAADAAAEVIEAPPAATITVPTPAKRVSSSLKRKSRPTSSVTASPASPAAPSPSPSLSPSPSASSSASPSSSSAASVVPPPPPSQRPHAAVTAAPGAGRARRTIQSFPPAWVERLLDRSRPPPDAEEEPPEPRSSWESGFRCTSRDTAAKEREGRGLLQMLARG